jgi:hypothetical protein
VITWQCRSLKLSAGTAAGDTALNLFKGKTRCNALGLPGSWSASASNMEPEMDVQTSIHPSGKDVEADHDTLWPCEVDGAELDIVKDSRGQPLVLGEGASAKVYLGRWGATLVAVKMMLGKDPGGFQPKVQTEADTLRKLIHPNVVLLMAVHVSPAQVMHMFIQVALENDLAPLKVLLFLDTICLPPSCSSVLTVAPDGSFECQMPVFVIVCSAYWSLSHDTTTYS